MDRAATFLLGVLAGALLTVGLQKFIESREISLETLEDELEERLGALERTEIGTLVPN